MEQIVTLMEDNIKKLKEVKDKLNDTDKRNQTIAEFMGRIRKYESNQEVFIQQLRYNTSWDWLMPVVIKLNKDKPKDIRISFEHAGVCVCRIYHQDLMHDEPQFERGNYEPEIMNIFLAVSDYCLTLKSKP